jgi:hypothetical protein
VLFVFVGLRSCTYSMIPFIAQGLL